MKQVAARLWFFNSIFLSCLAIFNSAEAQIVPDNTLPTNSSVTPGCTVCTINDGTVSGANLFHSFSEFSVPTGGEAFFNNPTQIENILTRVTGNSVSNIDGLLRANSSANLFFLNSNGIIFGLNARLNIGGSFFASTASSINFADGTFFSAAPAIVTAPLLTLSVPIGLQYGSNPGSIEVQGASLQLNPGQALALAGGEVTVNGGRLLAPGGRVELAGVATGAVGLSVNGSEMRLSVPDSMSRADVFLDNGIRVDVRAGGGGSIAINARNLGMARGSQLIAGINTGLGSPDSIAGNININAIGAINLTDESLISNVVSRRARGQGGDINITTGQLRVSDGSQVNANTFGRGNGGNLTVDASQEVQLIGKSANGRILSGLFASAQPGSSGQAGDLTIDTGTLLVWDEARVFTSTYGSGRGGEITINTDTLLVRDGAQIQTSTFGSGDGGNLRINASQEVQLIGTSAIGLPSRLRASAEKGSSGNAGNLTINTGTLLLRDAAQVGAGTFSSGNGGNLTVNASQEVLLIGSPSPVNGLFIIGTGLFTSADKGSSGNAGNLTINTSNLLLRGGAQISSGTYGTGNGGKLTVNASQEVQLIGTTTDGQFASGLLATADEDSTGKAGDLTINTGTLLVRDGAGVGASTFGSAKGGDLTVKASDSVQLSGAGGLFARSTSGSTAGNLTVETRQMSVQDGAQVTVSSPQGQAGNLNITANSLSLNQGKLTAETGASGTEGANINLSRLELLLMQNESLISAKASGDANGGNISIDTSLLIALSATGENGSDIIASAQEGNGGQINIEAAGIFGIKERRAIPGNRTNDIDASSELGSAGQVELITFFDATQGLGELPAEVAEPQIVQGCSASGKRGQSQFTVTGRGGLPASPNEVLSAEQVLDDLGIAVQGNRSASAPVVPTPKTPSAGLVEAQGWVVNAKGQVTLVAQAPSVTSHSPALTPATCNLSSAPLKQE